ncbi:MAG: VOC family protein [Rubricoccaceae bacterium]|nr:VOC family protein [Rubricoccaceae bacterium]
MRIDRYAEGHFCWADLSSTDIEATLPFYHDVLGWDGQPRDMDDGFAYYMFSRDGDLVAGGGTLTDDARDAGVTPAWTPYANVADLDGAVQRAADAGAAVIAPPADVGDHGRMAYLADPEGAVFGLWQPGAHRGFERVNAPGACIWNELNTRDPEAAQRFYAALFGWAFRPATNDAPSPYWTIHIDKGHNEDGYNGGILQMTEEWGDIPSHWMTYFAVDDVHDAVQRVRDADGAVHHGPFDSRVGPLAVVADPQGAVFMMMNAPRR